jgi:hypothetical protein
MKTRNASAVAKVIVMNKDCSMDGAAMAASPDCQLVIHASVKQACVTGKSVEFGIDPYTEQCFLRRAGATITGSELHMVGGRAWTWRQASLDDGAIKQRRLVFCARVYTSEVRFGADEEPLEMDFLLLLEPVEPYSTQYRRVGLGMVLGQGLFKDSLAQDISVK